MGAEIQEGFGRSAALLRVQIELLRLTAPFPPCASHPAILHDTGAATHPARRVQMIRILVVGDIRLYRDGVALHFSGHARYAVVGTAATLDETRRHVQATHPDVVVVDMAMVDSLTIVRDILRAPTFPTFA